MTPMKVKLKPLNWFEKNCYQDSDLDWWLTEELYLMYNSADGVVSVDSALNCYLNTDVYQPGEIIDLSNRDNLGFFVHFSWCIDEYYTPITHPEMFL